MNRTSHGLVVATALAVVTGCMGSSPRSLPSPSVSSSASSAASPSPSPAVSLPGAVRMPDVTMARFEHGVGVVGIARYSSGDQGLRPSSLWLTTDGSHWRDVTPAQAKQPDAGATYAFFEQASFLDARHGWVTTLDPGNVEVTVLATSDGGGHWRTIRRTNHSLNAGAATFVQLVSPTVATMDTLEPTGPGMRLEITTNAGRSWRRVYAGPPPRMPGAPLVGPFETEFVFLSARRAFAADGIPPTDPFNGTEGGILFGTSDGGRTWAHVAAPLPAPGRSACPVGGAGTFACLVALPTFNGGVGTVAVEVVGGGQASIGFDRSTDDGNHWSLLSHLTVPVQPAASDAAGTANTAPLVAAPTATSWWVVTHRQHGLATWTTSTAGRTWQQVTAPTVPGQLRSLQALDSQRAWIVEQVTTPEGAYRALYGTHDGGRHWYRVTPT